jgi:hypothetical protein
MNLSTHSPELNHANFDVILVLIRRCWLGPALEPQNYVAAVAGSVLVEGHWTRGRQVEHDPRI